MKSSYRSILHSTSLVGGSQVINIVVGILRGKVLALLIGPSGVGLAGMFQSAVSMIEVFAGMGLRQAGVRQVAVAYASGDQVKIARSTTVLRRASMVSALLGMVLVFVLRRYIARLTFGDETHATSIGWMALTLFFGAISAGQTALLQGTRRVHLLAFSAVASTAAATVCGLIPILLFREQGIALMHVAGAAVACLVIVLTARRISIAPVRMQLRKTWTEATALLRLGAAMMGAGLVGAAGVYATQVMVERGFGTAGVGLYLAAGTLSTFYVNMILAAMGADFFPRISALIDAPPDLNRAVNEQIQIGILLAIPGLLFTLTFAPWMLRILASPEFEPAADIVRWQIMGTALHTVSWPLSYVILAHGRSRLYLVVEAVGVALGLVLLVVCLRLWGLVGAGISSMFLYAGYTLGLLALTRRLCGFRLSGDTRRIVALRLALFGALYFWIRTQPAPWAWLGGITLTGCVSVLSIVTLRKLTGLSLGDMLGLFLKKD